MRKSVSVLVILSGETFSVILAGLYGAFLWSFRLVSKHMGLQVLEHPAAVRDRAKTSFTISFIQIEAPTSMSGLRIPGVD
jgi:hypothetical protein